MLTFDPAMTSMTNTPFSRPSPASGKGDFYE
jgi:hypothetical protein